MSIDAISGNIPPVQVREAALPKAPVQAPAPAKVEQVAPKADEVKLSTSAIARSLRHDGMGAAQIATRLGVDEKTVNGYLGLPAAKETAPTQANVAAEEAVEANVEKVAEAKGNGGESAENSQVAIPGKAV